MITKSKIARFSMPAVFMTTGILISLAFRNTHQQGGYFLDHEKDIAMNQPGPHDGKGTTTAFSFFSKAKDCKLVFRKRVLHTGASIGYHLQKADEIYYVVSGQGEMQMNGKTFPVQSGDAILTSPGSSHGISQKGAEDLVLIINYGKE